MIQRNKQKLVAFLLFCIVSSFLATVKQHGSGPLAGSLHPARYSNGPAASAGRAFALNLSTPSPLSAPSTAAPASLSSAASAIDANTGWQEVGTGTAVTQRVHPGDIVIHYGDDTRLLIYRYILRTVYLNGSPTSDTNENTTYLTSSNVYD